jgi:hypothetical protein
MAWHSISNGLSIPATFPAKRQITEGDNSYETDMAWPFRISH